MWVTLLLASAASEQRCLVGSHHVNPVGSLPLCRHYEGRASCCTPSTLEALRTTLDGLAYHFDRCTSCKNNWEHVLCAAACDARQADLVRNSSAIDPTLTLWGEERRHTPLHFTLAMHASVAHGST